MVKITGKVKEIIRKQDKKYHINNKYQTVWENLQLQLTFNNETMKFI